MPDGKFGRTLRRPGVPNWESGTDMNKERSRSGSEVESPDITKIKLLLQIHWALERVEEWRATADQVAVCVPSLFAG